MEQVVANDASSESIETIAPFMTIIGVDSTFVSTIRIKLPIAVLSIKIIPVILLNTESDLYER